MQNLPSSFLSLSHSSSSLSLFFFILFSLLFLNKNVALRKIAIFFFLCSKVRSNFNPPFLGSHFKKDRKKVRKKFLFFILCFLQRIWPLNSVQFTWDFLLYKLVFLLFSFLFICISLSFSLHSSLFLFVLFSPSLSLRIFLLLTPFNFLSTG